MLPHKDFNYYFCIKVGIGNKFLPYALEKLKHSKTVPFVIGYAGVDTPEFSKDQKLYLTNGQDIPTKDLAYLYRFTQKDISSQTILFTFNSSDIHFWKIANMPEPIKYFSEMSQSERIQHINDIIEIVPNATEKEIIGDVDRSRPHLTQKLLFVEHIRTVKREMLPAFLDSLSSYSWLTRGTFRHVCNINSQFDYLKKRLSSFYAEKKPIPFLIDKNTKEETVFGAFVRKYFDWLILQSSKSFQEFNNLCESDIETIASNIMSPTQLEYAAALLSRDLGFTPSYNIGKAIKDVDLRSTIIHKTPEHQARTINNLKDGFVKDRFSESVLSSLTNGNISFQCKNYFDKKTYSRITKDENNSALIYFSATSPKDKSLKDWISIEELTSTPNFKSNFPLLNEFIELNKFYLKNLDSNYQTLDISNAA